MKLRSLCLCALLACSACSTMWPGSRSEEPPSATETQGFTYDFRDVRIPSDLEIQMDKSSVTPVGGEHYGVLKFKGRVEPISLFDYFANTMAKDGWVLLAYQKYQRFLMVFTKESRVAVISIEEDPIYYTWVEVWVSPRQNGVGTAAPSYGPSYAPASPMSPAAPGAYPKPVEMERTLTQ
jgi:hypothetical protein